MVRANQDIRKAAQEKKVFLWQIAERCQISDTSFTKMLRRELPGEKKNQIMKFIDDLAEQREAANG